MKASLRALWLVVWLLAVSGINTASDVPRYTSSDLEAIFLGIAVTLKCKVLLQCSGGLDSMHPPFEYETFEATLYCPRRDFVVITTNGRRCVKPGSILLRSLINHKITGQPIDCKCPDQGIASMDLSLIKDYKINEASLLCPGREIIVTTTDGETCVNPELTLGKALYQFNTTGQPICKCSGQGIDSMHPRLFKNDQIYEVTLFCPRREIIVETANRLKECVNPESNLGKFIILKRAGLHGNCTCPDQGIDSMHPSLIRNHTIYEASQFCPGREIIVTTTNGTKECVNPESDLANYIYPTAGHGVGVGVGVGVPVFVLILICCVCCRKKKANPPTSECESEVHYATVLQHPFLNAPQPPPEQIMLHPPPYTPHPPPEQIMLYSTLNVASHQPGLDHPV